MHPIKRAMRTALGRRLPKLEGVIDVPGTRAAVRVDRDRFGIPHITAQNDEDAWFGLGFAMGQDRPFQVEALKRVVRGTLAEIAGPEALPIDRLSRRIGFHRTALAALDLLHDPERNVMTAFAAGITAGTSRGLPRNPHEFVLLRSRPTPHTAADGIGMLFLQSFVLATNWDAELARLQVLRRDGPEALRAIDTGYTDRLPVTDPPGSPAGAAADRLSDDLDRFLEVTGAGGGSNNWALAATKTATGRPILANDPHLAPLLPPHWYLCHLTTPEWSIAGAAFAAAPAVAAGHNGHAAWGVTAGMVDNTDLFVETFNDDGTVNGPDGPEEPIVVDEVIGIAGADPTTERVTITRRGPVIGPALDGEFGAISMAATWLRPSAVRGLLALPRVRSFEEFRDVFRHWPALSLNMMYADAGGTIGWQLIGDAPQRSSGDGRIPTPASAAGSGWLDEPVPFDDMPHASDPGTGWLATANNKPVVEGSGPYLGEDWLDGYRVARIGEVLAGRDDWDVEACLRLQMDQTSLVWRDVRDVVLAAADRPSLQTVHDLLDGWDGVVDESSPAAAVFELLMTEMSQRAVIAKAPRSAAWALGRGFTPLVPNNLFGFGRVGTLVRWLQEQPDGWFAAGWSSEIADALGSVQQRLTARFGPDPAAWEWGRVRPLTLLHAFASRSPLERIFNLGPIPWGGDANTVNQAAPDAVDPIGGGTIAIASLRMVVDVGDWDRSRFVLPGGQSGNPFSPHYSDQLALWRRGDAVPIAWSREEVARTIRHRLVLVPDQRSDAVAGGD